MTDDKDNDVDEKGKMMVIYNKEEDKHQTDNKKVEYIEEGNDKMMIQTVTT